MTRFEQAFLEEMRANHSELLAAVRDEQELSDDTEDELKGILDGFVRTFA